MRSYCSLIACGLTSMRPTSMAQLRNFVTGSAASVEFRLRPILSKSGRDEATDTDGCHSRQIVHAKTPSANGDEAAG